MFELFYMGGTLFMGILTLIFFAMIVASVLNGIPVLRGDVPDIAAATRRISYIKSIGLFALVVGILEQMMGLYQAFQAIEIVGDVSPALLAGGLKVSMISTIYGMFIYVISFLIWFGLSAKLKS